VSRYRKIDPRVWNDEKFRSLSDKAKLVFFFVLTHPHMTALGAMRASAPGLAAEIQWPTEAFGKAFGELLSKGMCKHDERASFLWLPNFLKYNAPESPNVVKSWTQSADLLPECQMKAELFGTVKGLVEALPEAFRKALPEAFAKSMPNQEQEQEQESKKSAKASDVCSPHSKKRKRCDAAMEPEAFTHWYESYPRHEARADALKAWLKVNPDSTLIASIMSATAEYAAANAETEKKFIKFPAAWLNSKRWQDEILARNGNGTANGHAKPAQVKDLGNGMIEVDGRQMDRTTYERRFANAAN
jgi:hypothetical protein